MWGHSNDNMVKPSKAFVSMDAEEANARRKRAGKKPAQIHPARVRKAQGKAGAVTAPFIISRLPRGEDTTHHFGVKNPQGKTHAVVCFKHNKAVLCASRHQATFGAVYTSGRDRRTPKQIIESGKTCPVQWCAGCVSALSASM